MSITYDWNITKMECMPEIESRTDVVVSVDWTLTATDGVVTVMTTGTQEITYDSESSFVEYADLSRDEVIGWVQSLLGEGHVNGLQDSLARDIANLTNTKVEKTLPWL